MRKVLWLLFLVSALAFMGCRSKVIYDNYNDSFSYKPESNIDYTRHLGPEEVPVNPVRK